MFCRAMSRRLGMAGVRLSTAATPGRLKGKVAVVTASTEGIGYAVAERLGQDGASVVISSRKQKNVDAALKKLKDGGLTVTGLTCHVGSTDDRTKLFEHACKEFGGVDILVSNAAANPAFGPILDTTEEVWDKIFDINVKSAFFTCKDAIKEMDKRGGGSIVIVSSIAGYVAFDFLGPYSVSKTALIGLTKALAGQCATKNIRVNGLAPGIIKTKFSTALWSSEEIEKKTLEHMAIKRFGSPEECAGTVSFLVSDDAAYLTGETVVMSGGMTSRL